MKILNRIRTLQIILLLLISNTLLFSQVVVEKSKDKVTISGIPYYVHIVRKGETSYSISKAYGISVEELTKENPPALYGVKEGQSLRIAVLQPQAPTVADNTPVKQSRDETRFIYHKLKPGETVYFLSKSYGVSENEIIQSNRGIDINKLPVGAEIAIPRREFMSDRQKFDEQDDRYIYHKVLKGESFSSIAGKYGVSVRELKRENRNLRFPQVGDFIRIPGARSLAPEIIEPVKQDTVKIAADEPLPVLEKKAGFTELKGLKGTLDIAVLLPFYLWENAQRSEIEISAASKGKKKVIFRSDDWIYPNSIDFVEMYEGILLAVDTLRSLGLNINLQTFDIKADTTELTRVIKSGKLAGMELIIGPVYSHNLIKVASYARDLGIPVVSPVPLFNNSVLTKSPNLFLANSSFSLEIAQKMLAKKLSEYSDHNFVFIHSDTSSTGEEQNKFKNLLFTELSYKIPYEEIKFKEFLFYSRSRFNNDSINRLSHALSDKTKNIVIIASEESPVISETIEDVHDLSRKFDVKVFGYPVMREIENLDPKYFFDLDMLIYSPSWIDYSKNNVKAFLSGYRKKYFTEPLEKSYAWNGYDIALYFLSGLAMHGKAFITDPWIHNPELLQNEFEFIRKTPGEGFENQKLFLLRYSKDYEVKLVEENRSVPQR